MARTRIKIAHRSVGAPYVVNCPCFACECRAKIQAWVRRKYPDHNFLYVVEG